MNLLVTGAAGLIGSRFIEWILENKTDVQIVGVDDLSGGYIDNLPPNHYSDRFSFVCMDMGNPQIERIFQEHSITHIAHFGAYAAEGLSPFIRRFNYTNNLVSTANLINFAIKYNIERFLFTSSMAVYGKQITPFSENFIPRPEDPYGISKFACEMDLQVAGNQHGLKWTVVRPHNVYGRNQNIWDRYRNVAGIWMWQTLNNQPVTIFGDGTQKRAFTEMQDCLVPLWNALTTTQSIHQTINLGGIREYSINEAVSILTEITGYSRLQYVESRHEVKNAWSTWEKSVELLGFEHKTSLEIGLKNMWEWAKMQPSRPRKEWKEFELDKGLYSFWRK